MRATADHLSADSPSSPADDDALCTVALVLGVLGLIPINGMLLVLSPVAAVVSVVALVRTRNRRVRNRGQAKVGLALSLMPLAFMGFMIAIFAAASTAA